jgi:hypothetical protein
MLSKNDKVLDIDDPITEWCRADVTELFICTLVVNYDTHVISIDNAVAVEVNDWLD